MRFRTSRRLGIVAGASTAMIAVAAGSAALALSLQGEPTVPLPPVATPASSGLEQALPAGTLDHVVPDTLKFLGGNDSIKVWRAAGKPGTLAGGRDCYITLSQYDSLNVGGTDCYSAAEIARRGVSVAGATKANGGFVGYALVAKDLQELSVDGRRGSSTSDGLYLINTDASGVALEARGANRIVRTNERNAVVEDPLP